MAHDGLLALSRMLHEDRSLAEVMDNVVASVTEHTRYSRAWLVLQIPGAKGLEVVGYALADRVRVEQRMAAHDASRDRYIAHLLTASETVVVDDLRTHPLADQEQVAFFGNRTAISVPMLRVGERVGVLVVGTFAAEGVLPPTEAELRFIEQVAALVTVVAARIRAESAQHALEERVRSAQRLESLGRMAGEVAHDFNSMLVSIMCNADLAMEHLEGHPAATSVAEIQVAADRAAALTRKLLAFSRGQPLERRSLDLGRVLQAFLPIVRSLLAESVSVSVAVDEPLGTIIGDAGQIEQVILNLVNNAGDALPKGGTIELGLCRAELDASALEAHPPARPGPFVVLSVKDSGVGMSREVAARIFEPLFSTKASGRGTGLGLAVVESVVRVHDGFVEVESEEGQGTTFRVFFPANPLLREGTEAPAPGESPIPHGDEHILLVDDDAQLRDVLERVLRGAGYRVSTAADGQAALECFDQHPDIALVVTDLMMPRMSGDRLRDQLRQRRARLPVLILTGYARGNVATEMGVDHLLAKPFSPRELLRKVKEVLTAARAAAR